MQRCHTFGAEGWLQASRLRLDVRSMSHPDLSLNHSNCLTINNQVDKEVGEAIRESGIPRSEIFVTTKFWPHFSAPENVELCLDQVLKNMKLDYVDLFLAHWPCAFKPISREALEKAVTGPDASNADKGISETDSGSPDVDWEHTSSNLAKQEGKFNNTLYLPYILSP